MRVSTLDKYLSIWYFIWKILMFVVSVAVIWLGIRLCV